jgi:GntR family galactonate operon transcriptional repressor
MTLNKTDRIVITLGKQIVSGKYVPGSALPAEAELCEEFETSRNIIREVFRSLMAKRLIEMKRYRGAFVAPVTSGTTSIPRCSGCWKMITTRGLSAR